MGLRLASRSETTSHSKRNRADEVHTTTVRAQGLRDTNKRKLLLMRMKCNSGTNHGGSEKVICVEKR